MCVPPESSRSIGWIWEIFWVGETGSSASDNREQMLFLFLSLLFFLILLHDCSSSFKHHQIYSWHESHLLICPSADALQTGWVLMKLSTNQSPQMGDWTRFSLDLLDLPITTFCPGSGLFFFSSPGCRRVIKPIFPTFPACWVAFSERKLH